MHMSMHVDICIYVFMYLRMHVFMCLPIYGSMQLCIQVYACVNMHLYPDMRTHVCVNTPVRSMWPAILWWTCLML